jgi:hypothetical protein
MEKENQASKRNDWTHIIFGPENAPPGAIIGIPYMRAYGRKKQCRRIGSDGYENEEPPKTPKKTFIRICKSGIGCDYRTTHQGNTLVDGGNCI